MRTINKIIIHCSGTKPSEIVNADIVKSLHKSKGCSDIGYHFVILRDGTIEKGRPVEKVGAHCKGHNFDSLGICLVGGVSTDSEPENNFTKEQLYSLRLLADGMCFKFNINKVKGHSDYAKDNKIVCPCFNVGEWYGSITEKVKIRKSKVEESKKNGVVKLSANMDSNNSDTGESSKPSRRRGSKRSNNSNTDD